MYMGVTNDKIELPLYIENTIDDLAGSMRINRMTIYRCIKYGKPTHDGVKILKIEVDE